MITKIQHEHRQEWVRALRSGQYRQTRSRLNFQDSAYCCLGVGCDISNLGQWECDHYSGEMIYVTTNDDRPSATHLPQTVAKYFGVDPTESSNLVMMNDLGVPFDVIADRIAAKL